MKVEFKSEDAAGGSATGSPGPGFASSDAPGYAQKMKEAARTYVDAGGPGPRAVDAGSTTPHRPDAPHNVTGAASHVEQHEATSNPATGAAKSIPTYLNELASWAAYLLSAKIDGFKLTMRNIVIYAALGVVGLIIAVAVIVKAVALFLGGLSDGLGRLFGMMTSGGGLSWLGPFLVGVLVLGGLAVGMMIALKKVMGASRKQTELKYEGKRIRQRLDLGRDVRERAGQSKKRAR